MKTYLSILANLHKKSLTGPSKNVKNNKAAGPDDIPVELLKHLISQNQSHVLDVFNHWWTIETVATEQYCAQVEHCQLQAHFT